MRQDEKIDYLIKANAKLFEHYEKINQATNQTILENEKKRNQRLEEAEKQLTKNTQIIIKDALKKEVDDFRTELSLLNNELKDNLALLSNEKRAMALQTRILSWKSILLFIIGIAIIISFTFKIVIDKKNELKQLTQLYKKTEIRQNLKEVINQITIKSCGGKACLKLDTNTRRWGKNGEYILIND